VDTSNEESVNGNGSERIRDAFEHAEKAKLEAPRPLKRTIGPGKPFPIEALGAELAEVAEAIHAATQAPVGIGAQSALASVNLVLMPHLNVELPTGEIKPIAEYFATVAESGERKTAADERALPGIREYERMLSAKFTDEWQVYKNALEAFGKQRTQVLSEHKKSKQEEKQAALDNLSMEAEPPPPPTLLCQEPTSEGLLKLLRDGHGFVGIFSGEGGMFVGGHGMSHEAKLRTVTTFSYLWDGNPISRPRAAEESYTLYDRRCCMHLLMQPLVADRFFGDDLVRNQGLLSRFLCIAPDPAAGTRPYRQTPKEQISRIRRFSCQLSSMLKLPRPCNEDNPRELQPCALKLGHGATKLWIEFHDYIESNIGPEGELAPIKDLANKAPEHAARLAATIEGFEKLAPKEGFESPSANIDGFDKLVAEGVVIPADIEVKAFKTALQILLAEGISDRNMMHGITVMRHYLEDALRIYASFQDPPDLKLAEKALAWIRKQPDGIFPLVDLYVRGPYAIGTAAKARTACNVLLDHGFIMRLEAGADSAFDRVHRREAFRLITEEDRK
jgi:Protein of unknown function (DUF3987)